jgi:hypothetical protein
LQSDKSKVLPTKAQLKSCFWFFAMMTMFCGTIMLIITFLRSVKSGYSPMNHEHYIKFHQFFKSLIVVFRFPAAMLGCLN